MNVNFVVHQTIFRFASCAIASAPIHKRQALSKRLSNKSHGKKGEGIIIKGHILFSL